MFQRIKERMKAHYYNCPRTLQTNKETNGEDGRMFSTISEIRNVLYGLYDKLLWIDDVSVDEENAVALSIDILGIIDEYLK